MKNQRNPKPQKGDQSSSATPATNDPTALQQTLAKADQFVQQLRLARSPEDAVAQAHRNGWAADPVQPTGKLLPVAPYHADLLPEPYDQWVAGKAKQMQAPADYLAVSLLTAVAGAVGNSQMIQPKANDPWKCSPNPWAVVIGEPASMKSPCIKAGLHWLYAQQPKPGDNAHEDRTIVIDTNIEKLGVILEKNPAGVLIHRDELTGFLCSMEKQGHEEARAFYLNAHDGNSPYGFERMTRSVYIPRVCVSIIGGIQPAMVRLLVNGKSTGQAGSDGFIERFGLLVWPDVSTTFRYVDKPNDPVLEQALNDLFARLMAARKHAKAGFVTWRFDDRAQKRYIRWVKAHQTMLRTEIQSQVLNSHLMKYGKLMPSLALLFALIDQASHLEDRDSSNQPRVGLDDVARAIRWTDYLKTHAARLYHHLYEKGGGSYAGLLLDKLRTGPGKTSEVVSIRDMLRSKWHGLTSPHAVEMACDDLEEMGWLQRFELHTGGRTSAVVVLHPKLKR